MVVKIAMACLLYEIKLNCVSFSLHPAALWNQFITMKASVLELLNQVQ